MAVHLSPTEKAIEYHKAKKEEILQGAKYKDKKDVSKGLNMTFKHFVQYLQALMKNQDPENPLDPIQLADLLTNYAGVNETRKNGDRMDEIIEINKEELVLLAANQVGNFAQVKRNVFEYDPKEVPSVAISYEVPADAKKVQLVISKVERRAGDGATTASDMGMNLVQVAAFEGQITPGKHHFKWDGDIKDPRRPNSFIKGEPGEYHVKVIAWGEDNRILYDEVNKRDREIPIWITGKVEAVAVDKQKGPQIRIGRTFYSTKDVTGYEEKKLPQLYSQEQVEAYQRMQQEANRRGEETVTTTGGNGSGSGNFNVHQLDPGFERELFDF